MDSFQFLDVGPWDELSESGMGQNAILHHDPNLDALSFLVSSPLLCLSCGLTAKGDSGHLYMKDLLTVHFIDDI